jgi:hypothetical protein
MATNWIRRKVWGNKGTSQKLITIPKDSDSDIKVGDLVWEVGKAIRLDILHFMDG